MISAKKLILLGAVLLVLAFLPLVMTSSYHMHLVIMTCMNFILGLSFCVLYSTGLLTMATSAFWGVGAYTSCLLVVKGGLSFWAALPLSGISSVLVAVLTGSVIARVPGIAFLVQTLVLAMILPELFGNLNFLGGWAGFLGIPSPDSIGGLIFMKKTAYYYLIIALVLLNVLGLAALYSSRVGRAWRSIKLNPQLAETLGISVYRYRLLAFMISSASAGLAGSFYAHYFQSLEPGMFTAFKSIEVQIFAILGGLDYYLVGPAIGAAIMTFVPELFRVSKEIEPIITGAVLFLLVIFLPDGILSIPASLRRLLVKTSNMQKSETSAGRTATTGV